ncbi:outer membrane beta-barrel protein [Mesonia sp. MT50]|uniref:Outer membrane beta-barrel protein n=1 Tax=Mesonia profundi TaxID=3070998 RepID=A0ABU1A0C6_9FLAO|nr:outer membrane beta-barrel protein [Mesonia profundi]MDQ7916716.1 outer membrane beta-barrel protein [Mesonia profundi]
MKKLILSLAAIASFTFASAQEQEVETYGFGEGDMFISGSFGIGTTKEPDDSKENSFNISPRFGYFVNERIAVGAQAGYSNQKVEDSNGFDVVDNSTFTVGVFGRYYFMPAQRFSFFGELGLGYGTTKDINDNKVNGINVGVAPGLSYFVSKHFALEATFGILGYNSVKRDASGAEATKSFDFGVNMDDINLGLIYKF